MHIIYVDESGTPALEPNSKHFVIAGLAMPLRAWRARDGQLRALLRQSRLSGVELHAAWMARRYPEQQRIVGFEGAPDDERRRLVTVERKRDLGKAALRGEFALEQVTSRFNTYLGNVHGPDALGIMVHDQHQAESLKLTQLFRGWHEAGTAFTAIPHLAETPLFVDSSLTLMVQVADLVAYATRRFFDNGETDFFDRFYPRYDRTPAGLLVGLRHFTARTPCACRVCIDHGR